MSIGLLATVVIFLATGILRQLSASLKVSISAMNIANGRGLGSNHLGRLIQRNIQQTNCERDLLALSVYVIKCI